MKNEKFAIGFLDALYANKKNISFIQVGANDGVNADFLRVRALDYGWSGILIEPHPVYFNLAKIAYGDSPLFAWERVAISNTLTKATLYYFDQVPPELPWIRGIASFNREHIVKHLPYMIVNGTNIGEESMINSVEVNCIKFHSIVEKYFIYRPDIVVIDVEGHEKSVVESMDFHQFRPKLIILETYHMDESTFLQILSLFPESYRGVYRPGESDGVIYDTISN